MSNQDVQEAIRQDQENGHWYMSTARKSPLGRPEIMHPVQLHDNGKVEMKTGSSNMAIPSDEYLAMRSGPMRKVGIWDFVPADDPAQNEIRLAHTHPESAGRDVYELRTRLQRAEELLRVAKCPECDGSGIVLKRVTRSEPECCGNLSEHGDCCNNPVPVPVEDAEQEPCQWCDKRHRLLGESYDEQ